MRGITTNTPKGAALGSPVVKTNDSDKKGVAYSYQLIGGMLPVLNQDDRNSLPVDTKLNEDGYSSGQRELGMVVYYMKATSLVFYQLRIPTWDTLNTAQKLAALADNSNWVSVSFASSEGGGHTILDEATPLTQRSKLAFVGAQVSVTDDAAGDKTVVTITATDIEVDSIPTSGSTNAISSGGVFNALSEKVDVDTYDSFVSATTTSLGNKVDVVSGMGLSENSYSDTDKDKVANLSGTNTGDETQSTIKTKLGAATTSADGYMTSTQVTQLGTNTTNIASNTTNIATNTSAIGVLASLNTTTKANLVAALNELLTHIETSYAFSYVAPNTSGTTTIDLNNLMNPSRTLTLTTTNSAGTPTNYPLAFTNLKNGAVLQLIIRNTYSSSLYVVLPADGAGYSYVPMSTGGSKTFEVVAGKSLDLSLQVVEFRDGSGTLLTTHYKVYKTNE